MCFLKAKELQQKRDDPYFQKSPEDDLPKSMTYPVDSLLSDWKAKNYIDLGKDCSTSTVNPQFSDPPSVMAK